MKYYMTFKRVTGKKTEFENFYSEDGLRAVEKIMEIINGYEIDAIVYSDPGLTPEEATVETEDGCLLFDMNRTWSAVNEDGDEIAAVDELGLLEWFVNNGEQAGWTSYRTFIDSLEIMGVDEELVTI